MRKKGFTLVEMLVVALILFIVLEVGYNILINNIKMVYRERNKAYTETQAKSFLDYIFTSLQLSYQETIDAKDNKLIFIVPKNNNQVLFSENTSNGVKIEVTYSNNSIYVQKTDLQSNKTSNNLVLNGNIKQLNITKQNRLITISLVVDFKDNKTIKTYTLSYTIRN